jgi:hypothetical protein
MLARDRAYLDWRYVKRPDADYTIYISEKGDQLVGYIVLRSIEDNKLKTGFIMDLFTNTEDSTSAMDLLNKAQQHFNNTGDDMILCIMPPKAYLAPSLRKNGFLMVSRWTRKETAIRIRQISEGDLKYADFNPDDWYLTQGDSDTL